MRIVLFTMDERVFTPLLLGDILERHRARIVAAFVCQPTDVRYLRRNWRHLLHLVPSSWVGIRDLIEFRSRMRRSARERPSKMLAGMGIPTYPIERFDREKMDELRALDPDIFLFAPLRLIAGPQTLSLPRIGAFNVHLGRIPEYRGGFSSFWALLHGRATAGVTLHRAVEELDSGPIVAESEIPVDTRSLATLMEAMFAAAGQMAADGIERIIEGDWQPVDIAGRPPGYFLHPTRADLRNFYLRGCTLS